jgi:hypothetical protein
VAVEGIPWIDDRSFASVESTEEDEKLEAALLNYAHRKAMSWGAERFAAEFERRDDEERRLTHAGTPPFRYPWDKEPEPEPMRSGLVDAAVEERVIREDPFELDLEKPPPMKHSNVPRPPTPEPEQETRRGRRRKRDRERDRAATPPASYVPSPEEAARMSPAGRRLYGLE